MEIKASDFEKVVEELKAKKFDDMQNIQIKFIKSNMAEQKKSVVWIFSDIEYYQGEMERKWFKEFNKKAKEIFEENGFKVNGVLITW